MPLFSSRHGYKPKASDILIREDAPESFRLYLLILMYPYMGCLLYTSDAADD